MVGKLKRLGHLLWPIVMCRKCNFTCRVCLKVVINSTYCVPLFVCQRNLCLAWNMLTGSEMMQFLRENVSNFWKKYIWKWGWSQPWLGHSKASFWSSLSYYEIKRLCKGSSRRNNKIQTVLWMSGMKLCWYFSPGILSLYKQRIFVKLNFFFESLKFTGMSENRDLCSGFTLFE